MPPRYEVTGNIQYGGTLHTPGGEPIEIDDVEEAERLKKLGVIGEEVKTTTPTDPPTSPPTEPATTLATEPATTPPSEPPTNPPEAPPGPTRPTDDADVIAAIKVLIPTLDAAQDFTQAGPPKVAAIETLLEYDVTSGEVKRAWEELQPPAG